MTKENNKKGRHGEGKKERKNTRTYSHLLIAKNRIEELPKRLPHRFASLLFLFFCFLQAPIHSFASATGSRASGRLKIQSDNDSDMEKIKGELQSVSAPRSQGRGDDATILWPWRSNWAPVVSSWFCICSNTEGSCERSGKKKDTATVYTGNRFLATKLRRWRNLGFQVSEATQWWCRGQPNHKGMSLGSTKGVDLTRASKWKKPLRLEGGFSASRQGSLLLGSS